MNFMVYWGAGAGGGGLSILKYSYVSWLVELSQVLVLHLNF
jgi:hypothetical protein